MSLLFNRNFKRLSRGPPEFPAPAPSITELLLLLLIVVIVVDKLDDVDDNESSDTIVGGLIIKRGTFRFLLLLILSSHVVSVLFVVFIVRILVVVLLVPDAPAVAAAFATNTSRYILCRSTFLQLLILPGVDELQLLLAPSSPPSLSSFFTLLPSWGG